MNDEIRNKMLQMLPHLRFAIEEAIEADASVGIELGILAKKSDGSGRVVCSFRADEFVEDLAKLLGAGPMTEEERLDAKAVKLLMGFGL